MASPYSSAVGRKIAKQNAAAAHESTEKVARKEDRKKTHNTPLRAAFRRRRELQAATHENHIGSRQTVGDWNALVGNDVQEEGTGWHTSLKEHPHRRAGYGKKGATGGKKRVSATTSTSSPSAKRVVNATP